MRHAFPRRQAGLSLVELMVSLTIGLVLMVAVVSAYLGSAGASRAAEAQGRMNEDAQAALTILAQQIRMTGNNPRQQDYAQDTPGNPVFNASSLQIRGCDTNFTNYTVASIADLACAAAANTDSVPDSIAIAYEADPYNTIKNSAGEATDCLGAKLEPQTGTVNKWDGAAAVATDVTFTRADNRFFIGTTTAVVSPSLFCKGNGGVTGHTGSKAQPLVENVENMQFTYGTAPATATSTLTVGGYISAYEIGTNADLAALPDDAGRWGKVVTVRICIIVRSESSVAPDAESAQYTKCDGTTELTPPDLRLRRAYSTTVVLRNRVGAGS